MQQQQFLLKKSHDSNQPKKLLKYLGYSYKKICSKDLSKIAQSCHTGGMDGKVNSVKI